METEAQGGEVTCTQSFRTLGFSKVWSRIPLTPAPVSRCWQLRRPPRKRRWGKIIPGAAGRKAPGGVALGGHLEWAGLRPAILTLGWKGGTTHSNNSEYSIMFGVKVKDFEIILIPWVCAQQCGRFWKCLTEERPDLNKKDSGRCPLYCFQHAWLQAGTWEEISHTSLEQEAGTGKNGGVFATTAAIMVPPQSYIYGVRTEVKSLGSWLVLFCLLLSVIFKTNCVPKLFSRPIKFQTGNY